MSLNWFKLFVKNRKTTPTIRKAKLEVMEMEGRLCPSAYMYSISNATTTAITGPGTPGNGTHFSKGDAVQFAVSVAADATGTTNEKLVISSSDGSLATQTITIGSTTTFSCVIKSNNATFSIDSTSFDGKESATVNVSTDQEVVKFLAQPLEGTTDSPIISSGGQPVTVEVLNPNGTLNTAFNGNVTVALAHNASAGGTATLSGTLTEMAQAGIATFSNLSINQLSQAGLQYTLSATLDDGTQTISNGFAIGHTLVFTTQPSNSTPGFSIVPYVVVSVDEPDGTTVDTGYNGSVTLQLGNNPGGSNSQIGGTTTVTAVNGVATFTLVGVSAGGAGYTLQATIPEGESATSTPFNVGDYLQFLQQPANTLVGQTISPPVTVEVLKSSGSPDTTTTGETVTLSIAHDGSGGTATLSGTLTEPVNPSTGIATFSDLSLNDIGSGYTLLASLNTTTQNGVTTDVSNGFTISSPPPTLSLAFGRQPSNTPTSLTMSSVVVDVLFPTTNALDTAYNGPVELMINPASDPSGGTASLFGNSSSISVNAVNGVATFNGMSINVQDNGYSLLASVDTAQLASNTFNITSASVVSMDVPVFKIPPANTVLGQRINPIAVDIDLPNGKLDTTFNGAVDVAVGVDPSGHAQLIGALQVNAVNGVAIFNNLAIDQAGTAFKLKASISSSDSALSNPFNIVNPVPPKLTVLSNPLSQFALAGDDVSFTTEEVSSVTPTVQWEESTNGFKTFTVVSTGVSTESVASSTVTTLTLSDVSTPMSGQQYRAVFTAANSNAVSIPATLTVLTAPQITKSPTSTTISAGGTATFTTTASGTQAPTVQWEESTDGGKTFTKVTDTNAIIKNATSGTTTTTTLTISKATYLEDKQEFIAVFSSPTANVPTSPVTMTVHFSPIITLQPVIQKIASGGQALYTASAIGDPAVTNVTWEVFLPKGQSIPQGDAVFTSTNIPGGLSTVLTLTNMPISLNGSGFFAVFTAPAASGNGNVTLDSATAVLDVGSPVIKTNPQSTQASVGATVQFTAAVTGTPTPSVQWQMSTNGGATYTNIVGATSTTLTIKALATEAGNRYRAVFTNALGSATTTAADLTVNAAPLIINQPLSQTVQNGTTVTFTALAAGSPNPTVQWYESTDGGVTFTAISGATSDVFNFVTQPTDAGKTYEFYADFTDSSGSTKTNVADLTIT